MNRFSLSTLFLSLAAAVSGLNCGAAGAASSVPAAPSAPATQQLATLTIRVTDMRNHNGQMLFGVFKSANGFPSDKGKSVNWQVKSIDADVIVFTASLPPGKYAASVLHDENKNNKMDMNFLGIPEEGYGVTNNPKPDYREAHFDEATFDLPPAGRTLTISLQYF